MAKANTALDGILQYLNTVPDRRVQRFTEPDSSKLDRLAEALAAAGADHALSYREAMTAAKLSRSEFLDALQRGLDARLFEVDDRGGEPALKLSRGAASLFG